MNTRLRIPRCGARAADDQRGEREQQGIGHPKDNDPLGANGWSGQHFASDGATDREPAR